MVIKNEQLRIELRMKNVRAAVGGLDTTTRIVTRHSSYFFGLI